MEIRKQKEIEYYDKQAEILMKESEDKKCEGDFEGFIPLNLASFRFCYKLLREYCKGKKILDYGCGNGIHSTFLVKTGVEKVIAIDLSEKSLGIAKERIKREGIENKIDFLMMDCEKMDFPDNSFDVIFDGGTFSSLSLDKVFPELSRVLKPEGVLVGIETFGHNPISNLKRKFNKLSGKRTEWAEGHILQMKDLKEAKKYFKKIDVHYFHIVSFLMIPFLDLPGGSLILKILEFIDSLLFLIPSFRKYAFKVVFILKYPKK